VATLETTGSDANGHDQPLADPSIPVVANKKWLKTG